MTLALQLYNGISKARLLADWSARATGVRIASNENGFESLTAAIRLTEAQAWRFYEQAQDLYISLADNGFIAWEGRIEDITLTTAGINITALGYWRALRDAPYTALWSYTGTSEYRTIFSEDIAASVSERHEIDNNNRLYIALRNGETVANNDLAAIGIENPDKADRDLVAIDFDYDIAIPTNWSVRCRTYDNSWATVATPWNVNGASTSTGSQAVTFAASQKVTFELYYTAASSQAGDTDANYIKITNLRLRSTTATTIGADDIVNDLTTVINSINSSQISTSTALVNDPGIDLKDFIYQDAMPADILKELALLGDNNSTPNRYEVGVYDNQRLYFRARGSAGKIWYIDVSNLSLQRTMQNLFNSVYATYQDANDRTLRTATATDDASQSRTITRRAAISVSTTDSTQAGEHRDVFLQDNKAPAPRAVLRTNALYDSAGGRYPLYMARAGDTLILRNLPPNQGTEIDKIRRFILKRVEYDVDNDVLIPTPEEPLASLPTIIARGKI